MRNVSVCLLSVLALAACAPMHEVRLFPQHQAPVVASAPALPPVASIASRGEFTIEAVPLDVWNAIGDIVVRTPQASYDSRSQMLGLYSVHYRGENLLVLAHALPLSDTIHVLTTQVTARTANGAPVDSTAATDLLAILQREMPAEVEAVKARAAAAVAAEKAGSKRPAHKHRKKR